MDHGLELTIPHPGNIWKFYFYNFIVSWKYWKSNFSIFYHPGNIGKRMFCIFSYLGNTGGGRAAPGVVLCCLGLFLEHDPGKTSMVTLELKSTQTLFWKLLPRPNHYAHKICIELLCRTPVSILKYLSPRPQNHVKNSKYSFLAWMSTWISKWRRRRRRPNNSPIWSEP